jgi:ribonuclease P protein component
MPAFETIKKRRDFLAVRGGEKASSSAFLIEAKRRRTDETAGREQTPSARFGFTITKKLGNAVRRNRIRRRLKAAVAALAGTHAAGGYDYVIVARNAAFDRPYADLVADLATALKRVHGEGGRKSRRSGPKSHAETAKKPAT